MVMAMSCIGYLYRIIYLQAAPGRMKIRFAGGRRYPQLLGIYPAPPAESAGAPRTLFRTPPALLPQSHLFGELRSGRRVVWRHHGVVGPQTPFFAILLGRHIVLVRKWRLRDLNFFPSSKQMINSGVIDFFTETAGLSGSAGPSAGLPDTLLRAACT